MAVFNARSATMWVGGVAVHDLATKVRFDVSLNTSPSQTFGHDAETVTGGLFVVKAQASGYIDFAGPFGGLNEPYVDRAQVPVTLGPTSTEGDTAMLTVGLIAAWKPLGFTVGETAAMDVEVSGTTKVPPVGGTLVAAEAARAATGNGVPYQLGAVGAAQAVYSNVHVLAAGGVNPTLDVTVASDSAEAFSTPTVQLTHPQFAAPGANQQSLPGANTDTWWRAQWTIAGTGPTFTFAVAVGIA